MKYKAFISYKHRVSTEFTENLELALKSYAKPLWHPPMAIFRDEKYLRPGVDLPKMIRDALEQSEALIYIASPEAAASPWVRDELSQWCSSSFRLQRLIIILTEGTIAIDESNKTIDWEKTNALPTVLQPLLSSVPFYADASAFNAPARQTLLDPDFKKLINLVMASCRGIDPIEMSGQEIIQHRKNLRNRNLLLSLTALMILLAAVGGGVAIQQRSTAKQQRMIALARQLAVRSQGIFDHQPYKTQTAVLLAAESLRRWPSSDADQMLRQGISVLPRSMANFQHKASVVKAVLSPDASHLVTVSDGRIYIWRLGDAQIGTESPRELDLGSDQGRAMTVAISPNGKYLLAGSTSGAVKAFEFPSAKFLFDADTRAKVTDILVTPDSRYFIARSSSPVILVGGVTKSPEMGRLSHENRVRSLSLSGDGNRLCTGTEKGAVSVWDWRNRKLLRRFEASGPVSSVACSSAGWLAAADGTKQIRLWDIKKGALAPLTQETEIDLIALSADERMLAGASQTKLRVWDTNSWREVNTFGLENPLETLVFDPQGKYLATSGQDRAARLWDVAAGREIVRVPHEEDVLDLSFDSGGRYLATASVDKFARVAAVPSVETSFEWEQPSVTATAYGSQGDYIATGDREGWIRVWSLDSRRPPLQLAPKSGKEIYRLVFSPDDHLIAAADRNGAVRIIDLSSQTDIGGFLQGAAPQALTFSADAKYVAAGGSDHQVRIWTINGSLWRTLPQADDVNGLAFSSDSQRIAVTTGSFGRVHQDGFTVWDCESQRAILEIKDQTEPFVATSFSKDDRYLVTTGQDFTARIWDVRTGREVSLPLFHDLPVWSAAFSADGRYVLTGSEDGTMRLWEWESGRELVRLAEGSAVKQVAFGQNDRKIVAATFDPSGYLLKFRAWEWQPQELIDEACRVVGYGLSERDWRMFFGSEKYEPLCQTKLASSRSSL